MSQTLQEFLDANLHRVYPLEDSASGIDVTNTFVLPSNFITNLFLCVPDEVGITVDNFYVQRIVARTSFIDVYIGYNDVEVTAPLGVFKDIATDAPIHSTYIFTPAQLQTNDQFTPLFHMSGQITIGTTESMVELLGSWEFDYVEGRIIAANVSRGLLNVQYISIDGRLFTGTVKFIEGANLVIDINQQIIAGDTVTFLTFNATLSADSTLQIVNDEDMLAAFNTTYGGLPINTINGLLPDVDRNFTLTAADCTTITTTGNGLTFENPCARPCCDEDVQIQAILSDMANLNERYANLFTAYENNAITIQDLQNKILTLGSTLA